jgi:APA family basic amino acid/polyamine antiporter
VLAILGALAFNAWGVKQTAKLNDGLVLFKVLALVLLAVLAFGKVNPVNFAAAFDSQSPSNPFDGLLAASALIFFAYLGFGRIATVAEEVENPSVNVPKAIFYSLAVCAVLYLVVMFVSIGVVGSAALAASTAPIGLVARAVGGAPLEWFLSLAALAATGSVLLTIVTGTSRVALAMSRHGQLPRFLSKLSTRGSPLRGMVVFSAVAAVGVLAFNFEDLVGLAALGSLVFYCLTNVSAFLLETKHPEIPKPFKTPFHPLVPLMGLVSCVALAAFIAPPSWMLGLLVFVAGLLMYALNSHLKR